MSLVDPRAVTDVQAQVRAGAVTIDRSAFDAIGEVDDGVVTVGAGVRCAAVEELAAPWLFASDRPDATVADWIGRGGGDLLWGLLGPTRAQVLGISAVLRDGSLVRFGGRVVKNVAGYDLTRAFVGAGDRLGFVVEATLRLRPAPRGWHAAISRGTPWEEARHGTGCAVWNGDTVLFLRAGESAPAGYEPSDPLAARHELRAAWRQVRTVCALDETRGRVPEPGDVFLAGVHRVGTRAEPVPPAGPLWDLLEAALSGTAKP